MLLNTITEIQNHLAIGNGTDFNRVKPHISNAETAYMRPLLGSDMFDELQEFYDELPSANAELTEVQKAMKELLGKVQKSIIHLAYWMGFAVLNAHISDGGFKRSESTTVKSLLKSQEDDLKEYFKDAGFNAMDEVLEYIELNIAHFNEYKLSPNWSILKSAFIPDTKTFNAIIDIKSSRLTFLRLKSYSTLVEDMEIRPILGTVIFEEVKAAMVLDEPVAKVTALLNYIRKPIAYLSTAMLMEESGADLTEKGLYFESTTATTISGKNKQPANADRIAQLASSYRSNGNSYLDQLKSYLAANATDWPTYSGQTKSVFRRDNTGKKTFWT
jgi:hypothetical protein